MLPPVLYKYESLAVQSLMNLKAQVVYFGSPLGFNDPYDCALSPAIRPASDGEVDGIRKQLLLDPKLPEAGRRVLAGSSVAELRQLFVPTAKASLERIGKQIMERGIACFSERNDDLLMWSHYGGRYRGFCLEFSTSFDPLRKGRVSVQPSHLEPGPYP